MLLGYCRVSSEGQNEGTSPEEQERVIKGYAMMRGIRPFDMAFFRDTISGSVPLTERPAGKEMLETARKGDTIVAVKLDRLFRSASDALNIAEGFKKQGIDLILTDMGNDPVTSNGPAKLFFTLLAAVAEFERGRISERVQSGKAAKRANGGHAGGSAPYGFKQKGRGVKAVLVPDEKEQAIIAEVKALAMEIASPSGICHELYKRRLRNRANGMFQAVQVQRILKRNLMEKPSAPPQPPC